jgi:threonylcarbamoyladenosine tRNA methylthiotransferase MtaB
MPRAAFTTLGCKVNQYETQRIIDSFEAAGFTIVPFDDEADVYVINTCSVTSIAESKSRYTIRRASRTNPAAKIVVTGCAGQMAINKGEMIDGADVVVPNPEKLETLDHLRRAFPEFVTAAKPSPIPSAISHRTRATLKIQDGCSVMCSYCSIPYTRPVMTSRPLADVIDEATRMAEMGYREIVLTGVLIGAYGPETGSGGPNFEELLEALQRAVPEVRLRISSIEMRQVTPRLLDLMRAPGSTIVPHLHIPLQAGDTQVLVDMNRPYTQADYIDLCERACREVPDLSLSTDILVGFPTETEERFESTIAVCERVKFLKIHSFRFSPRFGTPADAFGDPVSPPEKQRRAAVLNDISGRTGTAHARRFLGRTMRVLVESKTRRDGLLEGLTDNYLTVQFAGPATLQREFTWVRLDQEKDGVVLGELALAPLPGRTLIPVRAD